MQFGGEWQMQINVTSTDIKHRYRYSLHMLHRAWNLSHRHTKKSSNHLVQSRLKCLMEHVYKKGGKRKKGAKYLGEKLSRFYSESESQEFKLNSYHVWM